MKAKFFVSCMLLLMVLTATLLAFTGSSSAQTETNQCAAGTAKDDDSGLQAADGGIMWESVSWHLLSAVQ